MSDNEDSFTILGSTPTPSMDQRVIDESCMGLDHIFASSENCKMSHTPTTPSQSIQFADGEVALKQCLSVDNSAIGKLEASTSKMDPSMPIEITVYEDLIQKLKTENEQLREIIRDAEEHTTNQRTALEKELNELQEQIKIERDASYNEVFELNKQLSEKQSIMKNQTYLIERLEKEKRESVKVKSKLHGDECAQHITQEDHDRQIKTLQQEISVVEAKKSEFEILLSECKNQLKILEENQKVTQGMLKKNRTLIANQQKEIEVKNVEIKDLEEEIVLLKSRSEMDLYGSYEGRTTVDHSLTASVLADSSDDRAILICPLCDDKSYKDLGTLQEHVEVCIMAEENC